MPANPDDATLIAEQIAYYRARAPEYDEWFLREGRYDRGEEHRARWLGELREVEAALRALGPVAKALELAAGTGLWTCKLAEMAGEVVAVDASPEVLELNRRRAGTKNVRHVEADLFRYRPTERHDLVLMAFWLSHVPPSRFEEQWQLARAALAEGGRVFVVDSASTPESTARDHRLRADGVVDRQLNDGRRFEVVKVFYEPRELERQLAELGFEGKARATDSFFIYGCFGVKEG